MVSNGADGTGPFSKAMIQDRCLFTVSSSLNVPPSWTFYLMPEIRQSDFYSQDTIHLLAKFSTRLLGPSNLIVHGIENAGVAHIQYVYTTTFPKEDKVSHRGGG